MHLTIQRANLLKILTRTASVAAVKSPKAIYTCVHLEATKGRLRATTTDLNRAAMDGADTIETMLEGTVCVHHKSLLERVKAMPDGIVGLLVKGNDLHVTSGERKLQYKMGTTDPAEWPSLPGKPNGASFTIHSSLFAKVVGSISTSDDRANLHSCYVTLTDGLLKLHGTNGHLCTIATAKVETKATTKGLLSLATVNDLIRLDANVTLTFGDSENHAWVECDEFEMSAKLVDATYPDVTGIFRPTARYTNGLTVDVARLAKSVQAVSLASADKTPWVRFRAKDGTIKLSAESSDGGEAEDEMDCDQQGDDVAVKLDGTYLRLTCGQAEESMQMRFGESLDPIWWESGQVVGLIMPMRD